MMISQIDLSRFSSDDFDRGASRLTEALWILVRAVFFRLSSITTVAQRSSRSTSSGGRRGWEGCGYSVTGQYLVPMAIEETHGLRPMYLLRLG